MRNKAGWRPLLLSAVLVLSAAVSYPEEGGLLWQAGFPMRTGNQVLLMWLPYPGAERYVVVRKDLDSKEERRTEVKGAQFIDPDASVSRSYLYTVQAIMPGGLPGPSSEVKKLEGLRPPDAPRWVGEYQEGGAVHLAWEAVAGAAFYNLYRAAGDHAPSLLASIQDVKYVDAEVGSGVVYTYTVRSVSLQSQESKDSEPLGVQVGEGAREEPAEALRRRYVDVAAVIRQSADYRLREPTDVALSGDLLFVTDLGSRSVLALERDGTLAYRFAIPPAEYPGKWGIPWGIGISVDGERVALTFLQTPYVRVFTRSGVLLLEVEILRPPKYEEHPEIPQPMDVAVDSAGQFWVSDYTYAQVVRLDARGRELGRVGNPRPAEDAGPFRSPTFLATHEVSGQVFVVDSLLAAVFRLGGDGYIAQRWGRPKATEGALNLPKGISVTGEGDLLLVDGIRSSVQTFTTTGEIQAVYYTKDREFLDLRGLVSAAADPKSGDLYVLSKVDGTVYRLRLVE